ncbi:hypothetical protein E2C01_010896 [Portunus trituberculatus]|uniref:Uncharacterized protein n=1 Tax=Portunus trituberculatus TaxID=210409 RepID=A0A5B7DA34_PORTR|nr:hypothetical protein [Portunus trituberculatus]
MKDRKEVMQEILTKLGHNGIETSAVTRQYTGRPVTMSNTRAVWSKEDDTRNPRIPDERTPGKDRKTMK